MKLPTNFDIAAEMFNEYYLKFKHSQKLLKKRNKKIRELKQRLDKITELLNDIDWTFSRGINRNNETGMYELSLQDFEKLNALFDEWENMDQ